MASKITKTLAGYTARIFNKLYGGKLYEYYYAKGYNLYNDGNLDGAIKILKIALISDPKGISAVHLLVDIYCNIGEREKAFELLSNIPRKLNNIDNVWFALAVLYKKEKEIERAIYCYKRALEINSNNVGVLVNLGIILHYEKGLLHDALRLYEKAYENDRNNADILTGIGNVLCDIGKLEEAIDYFKKATELKPDEADLFFNLGTTQAELGRLNEAEQNYKQAILLNENDPSYHYGLGILYSELGLIKASISQLEKAASLGYEEAKKKLEFLEGNK
jgi:tetratricopeptide (TPR) repeat protein